MKTKRICAALALSAGMAGASNAAVLYGTAGAPYVENFDVLSSTTAPTAGYGFQNGATTSNNTSKNTAGGTAGIAGFYIYASGIAGATPDFSLNGPRNFSGPDGVAPASWTAASTYFTSGNTGSRVYSFGTATGDPATADRGLGTLSGSTANNGTNGALPGDTYIAMVIQNTTGQKLDQFTIDYFGEKWRDGAVTTSPQGYLFSYLVSPTFDGANTIVTVPTSGPTYQLSDASLNNNGFGPYTRVTALDYTQPTGSGTLAAVNGNANRTELTATITADWDVNQFLVLRWFDNDENGTDLGLGIDDLTFTATSVPEPASAMALLGGSMLHISRRRRA